MHLEKSSAYRTLVGKPEGNRPLERPRNMWNDNMKMDLRGIAWSVMDTIHLPQDRNQWIALVNTVMNFPVS
jgi:hypothetical protein